MSTNDPRETALDEKALSVGSKDASGGAPAQPSDAPDAGEMQREQVRKHWQEIEATADADPQAALAQAQALAKQVVEDLALQPSLARYRLFFARLLA